MTNGEQRQQLLRIARDAIEHCVRGDRQFDDVIEPAETSASAGVFVSIHTNGTLRGCIGQIEPDRALDALIRRCAIGACSSDPRFLPVTEGELALIDIELSLLGPLEPILGPDQIEIGRHGVVVEQGRRRGLLLPQVAVERQWDAVTFLTHTCHKAGLHADAWKADARLWRFEAEVFGDRVAAER